MIDKQDIESKDFSLALPELIGKIQFVGSSLLNIAYMKEGFIPKNSFYLGSGVILNEVVEDLEAINKALNG